MGEQTQRDEAVPGVPLADFVLVQANLAFRLGETLLDLPLKSLDVTGNTRLGLPQSITKGRNAEDILRYYFESQDEKGRPLLELKLLLVGRGSTSCVAC